MDAPARNRLTPLVLAAVLAGTLWAFLHVSGPPLRALGSEEGESAEPEPTPRVTEEDLALYIEVYKALQADHGLKLSDELERRGVSLQEFRALERRIQAEQRHVEKVRQALLEFARSRMEAAALAPPATPPATPSAPPSQE